MFYIEGANKFWVRNSLIIHLGDSRQAYFVILRAVVESVLAISITCFKVVFVIRVITRIWYQPGKAPKFRRIPLSHQSPELLFLPRETQVARAADTPSCSPIPIIYLSSPVPRPLLHPFLRSARWI